MEFKSRPDEDVSEEEEEDEEENCSFGIISSESGAYQNIGKIKNLPLAKYMYLALASVFFFTAISSLLLFISHSPARSCDFNATSSFSHINQTQIDPDEVAKAFVEHYYSTFDANRENLADLYNEFSMLSLEGQKFQGSQNIVDKLTSLPFLKCQHSIATVDCQPSGGGGLLVFVTGFLQLDVEQKDLKFSQMFHLMPIVPQGRFYVLNEIFRVIYA